MTKNDPILSTFRAWSEHPWAMRDEAALIEAFERAAASVDGRSAPPVEHSVENGVAVIGISGPISHRGGYGWTSAEAIGREIDAAASDPSVTAILLAIDSPGGSVYGIDQLGAKILAARDSKPIVGVATPEAASAAYWLGAQCSELCIEQGGQVGSIGVFASHVDVSKALADDGIKVTLVKAGKNKAERAPIAPLSEDARAYMQQQIDAYYSDFVGAVARGRGVSPSYAASEAFGQGRMVEAREAVRVGLADRVESLDSVASRLANMKPEQAASMIRAAFIRSQSVEIAEPVSMTVASGEDFKNVLALGAAVARANAKQEVRHAAATKENAMNEQDIQALVDKAVGGAVKSVRDELEPRIAAAETRATAAEARAAEVEKSATALTQSGRQKLASQQIDALVRDFKITPAEAKAEIELFEFLPAEKWEARVSALAERSPALAALTQPAVFQTDSGKVARVDPRDYTTPTGGKPNADDLNLIAQAQAETGSTDPKVYAKRLAELADQREGLSN